MTSIRFAGMTVELEGEGPPILMLHGLGGTSNSFQPLVAQLAGFRIIRPDLPGAGRSPTPSQEITVGLLVDAVENATTHLGIDRAHVVGHSFGALIAQHIAARHSGRVASLTLFGPILEPQETARERLRERAATARNEGMSAVADQFNSLGALERDRKREPSGRRFRPRESHAAGRRRLRAFVRGPGASRESRSPAYRLSNAHCHWR